jgi:hypothetical protein
MKVFDNLNAFGQQLRLCHTDEVGNENQANDSNIRTASEVDHDQSTRPEHPKSNIKVNDMVNFHHQFRQLLF